MVTTAADNKIAGTGKLSAGDANGIRIDGQLGQGIGAVGIAHLVGCNCNIAQRIGPMHIRADIVAVDLVETRPCFDQQDPVRCVAGDDPRPAAGDPRRRR